MIVRDVFRSVIAPFRAISWPFKRRRKVSISEQTDLKAKPTPPNKEADYQRILHGISQDVLRAHAGTDENTIVERIWKEVKPLLPASALSEEIVRTTVLYCRRKTEQAVVDAALQRDMLMGTARSIREQHADILETPLEVPPIDTGPENPRHRIGFDLLDLKVERFFQELKQSGILRAEMRLSEAGISEAKARLDYLKGRREALELKIYKAKAGATILTGMDALMLSASMLADFEATGVTLLKILGVGVASVGAAMGLTLSAHLGMVKPYHEGKLERRNRVALVAHLVLMQVHATFCASGSNSSHW